MEITRKRDLTAKNAENAKKLWNYAREHTRFGLVVNAQVTSDLWRSDQSLITPSAPITDSFFPSEQ